MASDRVLQIVNTNMRQPGSVSSVLRPRVIHLSQSSDRVELAVQLDGMSLAKCQSRGYEHTEQSFDHENSDNCTVSASDVIT